MAALYHGDGYYFYIDENGSFEARIHAIEPTGHLILQLRDGERRRYAFKEVTTVVPR
jgi:BirA family biotin operon repressor/biotin-[acetyl-CoA-carboxylase] ligase